MISIPIWNFHNWYIYVCYGHVLSLKSISLSVMYGKGGCVPKVPKGFGLCKTTLFFLIHKSRPPNIIEGITHLYIISIQCFLSNAIYNGLLKFQDDFIDDETFLPSLDNEKLIEKKTKESCIEGMCICLYHSHSLERSIKLW